MYGPKPPKGFIQSHIDEGPPAPPPSPSLPPSTRLSSRFMRGDANNDHPGDRVYYRHRGRRYYEPPPRLPPSDRAIDRMMARQYEQLQITSSPNRRYAYDFRNVPDEAAARIRDLANSRFNVMSGL